MTRHAYAEEIRKIKSTRKSTADNLESTLPEVETSSRKSWGEFDFMLHCVLAPQIAGLILSKKKKNIS